MVIDKGKWHKRKQSSALIVLTTYDCSGGDASTDVHEVVTEVVAVGSPVLTRWVACGKLRAMCTFEDTRRSWLRVLEQVPGGDVPRDRCTLRPFVCVFIFVVTL